MQSCPDQSTLAAFAIGSLKGDVFESLAQHISSCERCEKQLREFDDGHDPLVERLRELTDPNQTSELPDYIRQCADTVIHQLEGRRNESVRFDAGKHYSNRLADGECHLGRFELLEEIGVGSFGYVFRARDTELDRIVALKIQRAGLVAGEEETERFLREAKSVAHLVHPGIVSLYDTGQTDEGVCYLVEEFIEGETLESLLRRERLDVRRIATLVSELAEALHFAHEHGVIHRDVKPSNVLIDSNGHPHIADFGLAKRDSPEASMTSDGRILGTPAYMSPEHAGGAAHQADARSDIYSVGVILYEMLTGERPFQGTRKLVLLQVLEDEPRSPRELDESIPRDMAVICMKAMSKQPARRYLSAEALAKDLRCYLTGEPIQARPVGYAEKLLRWSRKYPFAAALFIGISFGSIAGFGYLRYMNTWFVQAMSLDHARLYSDMLEEFNASYSNARGQFFGHEGDTGKVPPPLPATLQIEIAQRISQREADVEVRVFSPFSFRKEVRPRDGFESRTLSKLQEQLSQGSAPDTETGNYEYYEFVTMHGRPYLKYARGQVMKDSCIHCHNTHKDTPKTDWKEGDHAGVLTLTRPLEPDEARARSGFRGAAIMMLTIASLLTFSGLVLAYRTRRRAWE